MARYITGKASASRDKPIENSKCVTKRNRSDCLSSLVVGITGMPGAKKSVVAELLARYGFLPFELSTFIRESTVERGLIPTLHNLAEVSHQLREEYGADIIARTCWESVKCAASRSVVIDGIRSMDEVKYFRSVSPRFILLHIHASPETRFERAVKRRIEPITPEEFYNTERYNLELGIGEVIALADYVIVNDTYNSRNLEEEVQRFYDFVMGKLP